MACYTSCIRDPGVEAQAKGYPVLITNEGEELAEKRYVSVVLRLAVDRRGRLIYGEIVDMVLVYQEVDMWVWCETPEESAAGERT